MITFPEDPYNGQEVIDKQVDGSVIIWTYDAEKNEWTYLQYGKQDPIRIFTDQVMVRDNAEPPAGLTVPPNELMTQKDVNIWQAEQDRQLLQQSNRVADAVDFSQNTVGKGYWTHQLPPEAEIYPRPGEFWTNGNETDFGKITEFKFNDTGLPGANDPGSLQGTREGDYLLVQCNGTNNFGYYVIIGYETENIANQIIRSFTVKPFREERFKGSTTEGVRHTVSTLRPVYTIVADEQPVVSSPGVFWYRESDDHLLISNYADGFVGEGPQWTDLTAGGDYLPLSGGTIDGKVIINKGPLIVNGAQVVELPDGGSLFTVLGSDNGNALLSINGAGSGKYFGKQNVPENIATVGHVSDSYLPLKGGSMAGDIAMNGCKITSLGQATQGGMAVSRNYGDTRYLRNSGDNQVESAWKIQSGGKTYFHVESGTSRIYYLQDPAHEQHPVNLRYADANYSLKDLFWKWEPSPGNNLSTAFIHWYDSENGSILDFNITTQTQNGIIDVPDFEKVNTSQPFSIYTKDATGIKILAAGMTQTIKVSTTQSGPKQYFGVKVAKDAMTVWRPGDFESSTLVICKIGGFIQ